jgi:DUF4097 and DUF4098 domain-containing protein YvlB
MALTGCVFTEGYKYTETTTTTETVPLQGVEIVEVELGSSDIEIVSKDDAEATFIIKKTYRSNDKEYGEELLKKVNIKIERDGSRIMVTRDGKVDQGWDMITKGYINIDITATIPAGIELDISTGSGDVEVDDRTAPVKVHTGSGDVVAGAAAAGFVMGAGSGDLRIDSVNGLLRFSAGSGDLRVDEVKGRLEVSLGSGDVDIDRIEGVVEITTGSGDVGAASSEGAFSVSTSSGDVTLMDHKGDVDIGTSSGDIIVHAGSSEGLIEIDTSSGEVDVVVYEVDSVEIDLKTSTGSIGSKIPIVVQDASRSRLVGAIGDGDLKIHISTTSGDIDLRQGSI